MDKVIKAVMESGTIYQNINYVVGVSGGPDSLCLLDVLVKLSKEIGFSVFPVHVNHKLRKNAGKEQKHIEKLCKGYGLECRSYEVDCKVLAEELKVSVEEAGRTARYSSFEQAANDLVEDGKARETVVIATAHNADDQSETVLHRVLRGTGIHGLTGIRSIREDESGFMILRPLLGVPRADIEDYIKRNELEPNIDESNFETDATRNKIRLELIPYIEKNINPNVKETLRRLAVSASIDDDYMEQVAVAVYEAVSDIDTVEDSIVLHTDKMTSLHVAIIRRVIANVLKDFGMDHEMTLRHISGIMEVMFGDNPSGRMDLPGGLQCERVYNDLRFYIRDLNSETDLEEEEIRSSMRLIPMIIKMSEYSKESETVHAAFDYDEFCKVYPDGLRRIVVRNRQEGDFIAISGGKRKRIQDYFVDSKIHKSMRDRIPLVAIGSEVLWIPPNDALPTSRQREKGKYSQNYQIGKGSKEILFLELIKTV